MTNTRREALVMGLTATGSIAALAGAVTSKAAEAQSAGQVGAGPAGAPAWRAGTDGQRRADLGNGFYRNPVYAGDHPDPNVLKDGDDYYSVYTSCDYFPGVVISHSRDLVNWTPLTAALPQPIGSICALDIAKHNGRYFIYIPAVVRPRDPALSAIEVAMRSRLAIFVVHADSMAGPWSEPADMDIAGYIDPGHAVGEDGKRYLFLSAGRRVRISDDGLRRDGPIEKVYDGWPVPEGWIMEGVYLEGPKVVRHDGWFYLFSAQGGTAGPPTSHMLVVARSRSIHGPWINCPANPVVHTRSIREPWWSRGHITPVQGPSGDWWMVYHGYENGYRTLGRQMLLDPFEWTADGWPRALGGDLGRPMRKPGGTAVRPDGPAISGPFRPDQIGPKFAFYLPKPGYLDRLTFADGALTLRGQGTGPGDSSPLTFIAPDLAYQIDIDVEVTGKAQGGLLMFYSSKLFCGLTFDAANMHVYAGGTDMVWAPAGAAAGRRLRLRMVYQDQVANFHVSSDGRSWRLIHSLEVSGYNHNMGDGFLSLRPAMFASGDGAVTYRSLRYRAIG